jgi:hypothetical protein
MKHGLDQDKLFVKCRMPQPVPAPDGSYEFKIIIRAISAIMGKLLQAPQPGASSQVRNKYYDDYAKKYKDISDHHTFVDPEYLTLADVELQGNEWDDYGDNTFRRMANLRRKVTATVAGFPLTYEEGEVVDLIYKPNQPGFVSFGAPKEHVIEGHNVSSPYRRRSRRKNRRIRRRSTRKN